MAESMRAYDFERFETAAGSAAPQIPPRRTESAPEKKQPEIVRLPKKELEKSRRPKINPFKAVMMTAVFAVIAGIVSFTIYNQVQLTELTEQISQEGQSLEKAKSLEVELTMKTAEKMNRTDVEKFAREELGMAKINDSQVTYVNMVQQDKGEVLQQDSQSVWAKLWAQIQGLFGG